MKRTKPTSFSFSLWAKIWPVLLVAILLFLALLLDAIFSSFGARFFSSSEIQASPWMLYYFGHTGMLAAALVLIYVMSGGNFQKFGLRLPVAKSYMASAAGWGIVFGVIMTIVDYLPDLLRHTAPAFSLSTRNVIGWLSFEGLFAGTAEEILFRGLLVSYLASKISGRVRIGPVDLQVAGVIVALLFCLAHFGSFLDRPFWVAMGQQTYAFVWAIFYAYWLEKSGSVLAPIIGHNVGNFIEYCFVFLMVWFWR